MKTQKLYNISFWIYTPCDEGKVEMSKPVDDFNEDRRDVRILVWGNVLKEQCVLIKTIETLTEYEPTQILFL